MSVRLAKQETLTPPEHLVSPLVCKGPWMSSVVLYCWCHSDSASLLMYFTLQYSWIYFKNRYLSLNCVRRRIIEYITTLRKGQGNPIRVSMIFNVANNGHEDGILLFFRNMVIVFLPRLLFFIKSPIITSFYLYKAQCHGIASYDNVMLLAMPWPHNALGAKWRCKNVVSPRWVRHLRLRQSFPRLTNVGTDLSPVENRHPLDRLPRGTTLHRRLDVWRHNSAATDSSVEAQRHLCGFVE